MALFSQHHRRSQADINEMTVRIEGNETARAIMLTLMKHHGEGAMRPSEIFREALPSATDDGRLHSWIKKMLEAHIILQENWQPKVGVVSWPKYKLSDKGLQLATAVAEKWPELVAMIQVQNPYRVVHLGIGEILEVEGKEKTLKIKLRSEPENEIEASEVKIFPRS